MQKLVINIKILGGINDDNKALSGGGLAVLKTINNAWVAIKDGHIEDFGEMKDLSTALYESYEIIDARAATVLPCWCDSHTHIVFAATREDEFIDKLKGKTYAEIAANGGGILNSAKKVQAATEEELYDAAWKRLSNLIASGTGAVEIKSGYGLTPDAEIKMLRVIKAIKQNAAIPVKATFLGAHTYPAAYKENHTGYIQEIIEQMLPVIQQEKLADYIDVFCEDGFFSAKETATICQAGKQIGLLPKLHVNQLNSIGGIEAGIAAGAVSMDHLETLSQQEIELLGNWKGISTLLPTAAFFLRMPYQPARKLIDAGATIALASDYNPGSSPSGNMNFVAALSSIQMKMLPEEVINAATINGACAMQVEKETGSIAKGKKANFIFTHPYTSIGYLFYAFGDNHIDKVMINGNWFTSSY